jgi:hypothetical protein
MGRINRRIYAKRRKRSSALKLRNDASTGIMSSGINEDNVLSQEFANVFKDGGVLDYHRTGESTPTSRPTINKNDDIFGQMIKQAQIKKSEAAAGQMSQGGGLSGTYKITKVNDASEQPSEQNFSPRPRGMKPGQLGGLRSMFEQA